MAQAGGFTLATVSVWNWRVQRMSWMPRPSTSPCRCFHGVPFRSTRVVVSCTYSSICAKPSRASSTSLTPSCWRSNPVPSKSWTIAIRTSIDCMPYLRRAPSPSRGYAEFRCTPGLFGGHGKGNGHHPTDCFVHLFEKMPTGVVGGGGEI
jgi:hypothetical protein